VAVVLAHLSQVEHQVQILLFQVLVFQQLRLPAVALVVKAVLAVQRADHRAVVVIAVEHLPHQALRDKEIRAARAAAILHLAVVVEVVQEA
jgi:hypothetical protein